MHGPRLTFIIPAFNASATILDTLESLRSQTMPHWRAIVVNDGSTDDTAETVRVFDDPRVELVSQENRGLAGARNTGLRHMPDSDGPRGMYVSFLDADDTIAPAFCELMLVAIGDHDAVACAYEFMDHANRPLYWTTRPAPHDATIERLIETNAFVVTCVVRLDAIRRLTTLPSPPARPGDVFDENLRVLEDWDLWLRATASGFRWAPVVDQPLFRYRCTAGLSRNIERMWTAGKGVITRAPVADSLKPRALRRWSLRNAAHALAIQDAALSLRILAGLDVVDEHDLITLAENLGPAFQRASLVGSAHVHAHVVQWRSQIERALAGQPWLPRLLARFDSTTLDWAGVAKEVASLLRAGDIPVVYGMGWNGQAFLAELAAILPVTPIAWIDDHPKAAPPASLCHRTRRVQAQDLTPRHAVIVTPNSAAKVLAQLRENRARVLWPT